MIPCADMPHPRMRYVDYQETYGRHILDRWSPNISCTTTLDLGCGNGSDLMVVKKHHPTAHCIGVEYSDWAIAQLVEKGIEPITVDLERECLPLADASVDLVIGNQILEHTKEIFWINHEVFRVLKPGGHFYLGVPNVLSLHNRLLGLVGVHPTTVQLCSPHVRAFSRNDTLKLYQKVIPLGHQLASFGGSQFYPLPKSLARPMANWLPSLAVSIFFLIRKTGDYDNQFLTWLDQAQMETNYFRGPSD
jgi:ubiquinone/menaquinone biosynthesis C-methylase UbiE